MITFEEAERIALDKIGEDCALYYEDIIEKPYGWYFSFQSRKYIETGNLSEMLVGSGGFIVEKESGRIVNFGSVNTREKNFEIYEKGFLGVNYDLIVKRVKNLNQAVRLLHSLRMYYIETEFAYGVEWKISKTFNEKQIKNALSNLPYTFPNQIFSSNFEIFQEINDSKCLEYELKKLKPSD
jgi:hypothetical protein